MGLYEPCAAPLDPDRTMVVGGEVNSGPTDRVFVHSASEDSWEELEERLGEARSAAMCAATGDGRVWVAGGLGRRGEALASTEIFEDGRWRAGPELPSGWSNGDMVMVKGRPVIAGGIRKTSRGRKKEEKRLVELREGRWEWRKQEELLKTGRIQAAAVLVPNYALHDCGERNGTGMENGSLLQLSVILTGGLGLRYYLRKLL